MALMTVVASLSQSTSSLVFVSSFPPYANSEESSLPFKTMSKDFWGLAYFKAYEVFTIITIIKNYNLSDLMPDPNCLQAPRNG